MTTSYWHGGPRIVGDHICSPAVTGFSRSGDHGVHVSTDRTLAEAYASTLPRPGWVYEVEPLGSLEPVPSLVGGPTVSYRCDSARIIRRFTVPATVRDAYRAAILPMLEATR
jgi:hypothetical protein